MFKPFTKPFTFANTSLLLMFAALSLSADVRADSLWSMHKVDKLEKLPSSYHEQRAEPLNRHAQAANQYLLTLNPEVLGLLEVNDELNVELPSGTFTYSVSQRQHNPSGSLTIIAKNSAVSRSNLILTKGKNTFHLSVDDGKTNFTARGTDLTGILVSEVDYQQGLPSIIDTVVNRDEGNSNYPTRTNQIGFNTDLVVAQSDTKVILDVLFYYTKSTTELYQNEPRVRLEHLVSVTNMIFSESQVFAEIRAEYQEIDYEETSLKTTLQDMELGINGFEGLAEDRYERGADIVTVFQPFNSDIICGIALRNDPSSTSYLDHSYGAVGIDCIDYVTAHEIGHNLGLNHSHRSGENEASFPYGVGHGIDNAFHTIMSARRDYYAGGPVLPKSEYIFSNPDLTCAGGFPCGIPIGEAEEAHAVAALNDSVVKASAAYSKSPDLTTVSQKLPLIEDVELRNCIAENSQYNSIYPAVWRDIDCLGYVISDISGLAVFPNINSIKMVVDGTIDLSTLSSLERLFSIQIVSNPDSSNPVIVKNLDSLRSLSGLANLSLVDLNITDISFLTDLQQLQFLSLAENKIEDFEPLFALTELRTLDLSRTNFPTNLVSRLEGSYRLTRLRLNSNNYTEFTNVDLPSSLRSLHLENNLLSLAPSFSSAVTLEELYLQANPMSTLTGLESAPRLMYIDLFDTSVVDIAAVYQLEQLETLLASNTQVIDLGPIKDLERLSRLEINHTLVTDIGPALIVLSNPANQMNIRQFSFNGLHIPCWQREFTEIFARDFTGIDMRGTDCFFGDEDGDYDGDGIPNRQEIDNGTNPVLADSDDEGVNDTLGSSNVLDVDSDGKADIFVRNTDTFYNYGLRSTDDSIARWEFGKASEDIPLHGDFDGDGVTDIAVRRPSTHMWYVLNSSDPGERGDYIQRVRFGLASEDIPVVADYDGDGKTDFAVYRPSTKMWYILTSTGEGSDLGDGIMRVRYGLYDGDIPVTGDFDGDGKADIAIRGPSTHTWHILRSSDGQEQVITFGLAEEDIPVPADYDGDGITDLAVRRPSTQMWYILNSSGEPGPFGDGIQRIRFGLDPADIPIVDDYDGDGKADIAVRRASTQMQYILTSSGEGGDRGDGIMRVRFGLQEKYVPFQAPIHIRMQMVEEANER